MDSECTPKDNKDRDIGSDKRACQTERLNILFYTVRYCDAAVACTCINRTNVKSADVNSTNVNSICDDKSAGITKYIRAVVDRFEVKTP